MKTHCPRGHEYTEENTYVQPKGGRVCKICKAAQQLEFKKNNPDKKYESTKIANAAWKKKNPNYWVYHQKKRHGLTEEKYNEIMQKQNFVCAICKKPFVPGEPPRIDHNHECCPGTYSCGECVRGILCANCNWGLGSFHDNETNLRNAIEYVNNPPNQEK